MTTKLIAILLFLMALSPGPITESWAAPSNGTRFPARGKVELGYEYDAIFARPLDRSYGTFRSQCHFYTVTFAAFDWLSLDGKAGLGDTIRKGGDHLPTLKFNTGFAGGYGLRVRFFEYDPWKIRMVAGFQHISTHPCDRTVGTDKYETFLDDWQVSSLIAKDFKSVTAYAGLKGSDCEFVYKINKHDKKRRFSEQHIGLITGIELFLFRDRIRVGAEGRFFDETAFSTSVSCLF